MISTFHPTEHDVFLEDLPPTRRKISIDDRLVRLREATPQSRLDDSAIAKPGADSDTREPGPTPHAKPGPADPSSDATTPKPPPGGRMAPEATAPWLEDELELDALGPSATRETSTGRWSTEDELAS